MLLSGYVRTFFRVLSYKEWSGVLHNLKVVHCSFSAIGGETLTEKFRDHWSVNGT
jgi:hypothetical protein